MRCPKCGYITFDHLDNCPKCKKDISKVSLKVVGTTYNVTTPLFLKFSQGGGIEEKKEDFIAFDNSQDGFDVVDPDLDVLVDEPEEGDDFNFDDDSSFADNDFEGSSGDDFSLNSDEPEDGEIDLGGFEDAFEQERPESEGDIALDFPDELADISDLSQPEESSVAEDDAFALDFDEKENEEDFAPALDGVEDDLNLNLDLEMDSLDDKFTLSLDDDEETEDGSVLGELSLDDIGLSEKSSGEEKKKRVSVPDDDMDGDLDFTLDLGGLSLDRE